MSDEIERLLREAQRHFRQLPIERTAKCPSDMNLFMLCFEEEAGLLKNKLMGHVATCPYCSHYVLDVIKDKIKSRRSLSEAKKKFFPLPEEIDWTNIKTLELFKENTCVSKKNYIYAFPEVDFDIKEPGFYHIAIDTGQIIWRRDINANEINLSHEEQVEIAHYGLASGSSEAMNRLGFDELFWNGGLQVKLKKGLAIGKLIIQFNN